MVTVPERQYSVLATGVSRIRVLSLSEEEGPMLHGAVVRLHDEGSISDPESLRRSCGPPQECFAVCLKALSRGVRMGHGAWS